MKSTYLFKLILLAAPIILLIYVFLIRDRLDKGSGGIGGGGYDLTKMYTILAAGLYLLVLNFIFLIQDAGGNKYLLLVGVAAFIVTVIMAVRSF
jgi:hypothetical protein